jgi:hypothetical protein
MSLCRHNGIMYVAPATRYVMTCCSASVRVLVSSVPKGTSVLLGGTGKQYLRESARICVN